jgi:hypothetical protein
MDVKTSISQHDALLAEFASARAHELADTFWTDLLNFPVALTRLPPAELDAATTSYCEHLRAHAGPGSHMPCACLSHVTCCM